MNIWRSQRWRLWAAFGLLTLFVALPGPHRSPFSGIPFSTKAHVLVPAILLGVIAAALFPPRRALHRRWLVALTVLCAAKVAISPLLRAEGWRGEYWTAQILAYGPNPGPEPLYRVRFFQRGVHDFRVDPALAFNDVSFALFYVNDPAHPNSSRDTKPRQLTQPLRVHWSGWIEVPSATTLSTTLSAAGTVSVDVDGAAALRAASPENAPIARALSAGIHRIDIVYDKPPGVMPRFALAPLPFRVLPWPGHVAELQRSGLAAGAINLLGAVALLLFAAALIDAYRPLTRFLLDEIWAAPDRLLLVVFVAAALVTGLGVAFTSRGATWGLSINNDPWVYEFSARAVLFDGLLMKADPADTKPFYHYPFYSYVLSGAHALFGEDVSTIVLFNWICVVAAAILFWALLRKWLTVGSTTVAMIAFWFFAFVYMKQYTFDAFTDNLYVPMCLAIVLACAAAFERASNGWLLAAGVLTALGAVTRPSLTLFPPVFIAAVLLFWPTAFVRRAGAVAAFVAGFAAGVAPFFLRNWIVARRFVLMASMPVMLPLFLYSPEDAKPTRWVLAHSRTSVDAIEAFFRIFASAPGHYGFVELRKVLFTLGYLRFGQAGIYPGGLFLFPLLFALAAWARRIPRPIAIAISAFALSHLCAMVVATPWSYGFKSILPFHLALMAGAAFLLPRRSDVVVREVAIQRNPSPARRSVSVVLPTYNEKGSIRQVILDFFATGVVDEVVVVNNNAVAGTSEEVAGTGAREVFEPRQGYGAATRHGLREAKGDVIVICEPDGTFLARDIMKLLAYADDFDVVYGSRTLQPLVWRGANMGFFLRFGNWAVAKYMQILFNTPTLSDVGCTMRLVKRSVAEALADEFRIEGSQFGPEMMLLTVRHGYRIAQVPVNYAERVGVSSVTGDLNKALRLGLQMIALITWHRLRDVVDHRATVDEPLGAEQTPTMNS